ncbi:MAG: hypothetical protein DHS20C20_33280 [Ardenticatenaceae bacterium]|nr:MAG: hypothetical protein DHS20C20_33280 [Ardenticatenaceae bacterium]
MTQAAVNYQFRTRLDLPYEQVIEKVTAALKEEGFGILTEINVQATLKRKLDIDFQKYIILGACNPSLANQALAAELEIGLLLPCNVIVYEDEKDGSVISIVDPIAMLGVIENPNLAAVANEARVRLQRVSKALETVS